MSVLIKGMEMPTSCLSCPLQGGTADCRLTQKTYNWGLSERPSDCPLIEIPPHGRLIDADVLTIILSKVIDINASIEQRNEATDQERRCLWWFEQQIGIAPTIIEAEGGE